MEGITSDLTFAALPRYPDPPPHERPTPYAYCSNPRCNTPVYVPDALRGTLCLRCYCPDGIVYTGTNDGPKYFDRCVTGRVIRRVVG